jgi:hypothetical protein
MSGNPTDQVVSHDTATVSAANRPTAGSAFDTSRLARSGVVPVGDPLPVRTGVRSSRAAGVPEEVRQMGTVCETPASIGVRRAVSGRATRSGDTARVRAVGVAAPTPDELDQA